MPVYLFLFISFLTGCFPLFAQVSYPYAPGRYLVDTTEAFQPCYRPYIFEYFSVDGKYPESSARLLARARQAYQKPGNATQSGFITIRFVVNCQGQTGWYHVYQIDNQYHP